MALSLHLDLDIEGIVGQLKEFQQEVEQDLEKSVRNLALTTRNWVGDRAEEELHSSLKELLENLEYEEISPGIHVVTIKEPALWIEEGTQARDMKKDLLKNGKMRTDNSGKYKVIPFDWKEIAAGTSSKSTAKTAGQTQQYVNYLKESLKKEKLSVTGIERNKNGSPKVGKLHEFNFGNPNGRLGGPGWGHTPLFTRLSIYQNVDKKGDIQRGVFTFRTVTDTGASDGKWEHPGTARRKFLDRALIEAEKLWEEVIVPEILKRWE